MLGKLDKSIALGTTRIVIQSLRNYPARGTKPKPRHLWDTKHLNELTNGEYTHLPLRVNRLGGRDPETGRKVNQHIGGGVKFDYFMIDFHRRGPNSPDETYDERVLEIRRDPNRSAHIALVAGAKGKRWILATENMVAGQIIKTSGYIPPNPVVGIEGNAYPLGALSVGTLVNSVERYADIEDSDVFVIAAGTAGVIVRHQGQYVVVRLAHKHEFSMHQTCMATVGKLSHGDFDNKIFGSANMHRRFGYKMASGLWHKKDGYCGRKIRPLHPVRVLEKAPEEEPPFHEFTLTKRDISGKYGPAATHPLVTQTQFRFNP
uniref:Ribosomal protein L2 C-terminal domain-containing protein n=1 Tax=Panagrolaimus davidi TaxID=227884 RepID=A0A914PJH4_9BILA